MNGDIFEITEKEYKQIGQSQGLVYIKSCDSTINVSSIVSIFPKSKADEIEKRKEQQTGVLYDGTRVKRYFGQWVDNFNQVPDDKNNYHPVKIDPNYYPEIAMDIVATEKEFKQIKADDKNYYEFLLGNDYKRKIENNKNRLLNTGFKKLI